MSNYVQSTNFATKDALSSGDPLKIVKGTEINTEFNNIATAVATKADLVSPTFTTPALGTPSSGVLDNCTSNTEAFGTSNTQLATTAFVQAALQALHPVGSIYINATNATNPGTLLGFGTWVAFGAGRVPVGFSAADPLFDTAEETGGSKDATLPTHTHTATSTVTDPGHQHTLNQGRDLNPGLNLIQPTINAQSSSLITNVAFTGITVGTTIANAGTDGTNANLQPYITVFMFKRTA